MNGAMPKAAQLSLRREDSVTLDVLTRGFEVAMRDGVALAAWRVKRAPHTARMGTGWRAVIVRSPWGEESTLLFEPWAGGRVSGILRLAAPPRMHQRV